MIGERHAHPLGLAPAPHVPEAPPEDRPPGGRTLRRQLAPAPLAGPARDVERQHDAVPRAHRPHGRARLLDHAHELVAHDGALLHERAAATPVILVQVGAAHRARRDPHDDVGRVDDLRIRDGLGAHVAHALEGDRFHRFLSSNS